MNHKISESCLAHQTDSSNIIDISPAYIVSNISSLLDITSDIDDEYWTLSNFLIDLPMKWDLSFALVREKVPIAYAISSSKALDHCHLHHFMVHRKWRRNSLGRRMINEIERRAMINNLSYLTLNVPVNNDNARSFYAHHGFNPKFIRDFYYTYEKIL